MSIYIPYFYVIQEVSTGKYYAGSKYGQDANPDFFMIEGGYTTSSNAINQIIKEQGLDSFVIRKIRTFETRNEALDYETRFLQKVDAASHPLFYNGHNNDKIYYNEEYRKARMLEVYGVDNPMKSPEIKRKAINNSRKSTYEKYGVEHNFSIPEVKEKIKQNNLKKYGVEYYAQTEEYKEKYKQTCLEKYDVEHYAQTDEHKEKYKQTCLEKYGVEHYTQTDEHKKHLRNKAEEYYSDPIKKEKHRISCKEKNSSKNRIWINRDKQNKRIYPTELDDYLNKGWNKGRYIEKENAFWNYDKRGENNPFFGKKHSKSTKRKISDSKKEKYEDPEYRRHYKEKCLESNKRKYNSKSGKIVWVNNGEKNKRIGIEHLESEIENGWQKGRIKRKVHNET